METRIAIVRDLNAGLILEMPNDQIELLTEMLASLVEIGTDVRHLISQILRDVCYSGIRSYDPRCRNYL